MGTSGTTSPASSTRGDGGRRKGGSMSLREFFLPRPGGPKRDDLSSMGPSYLRSYLVMRILIGSIGILLPIVLIICAGSFVDGWADLRGSLSAYYHSGMRDVFVGSMYAVAAFLVTYKVVELRFEGIVSGLAGLSAFVLATFPTDLPKGLDSPETPLQIEVGQGTVSNVHYGAAIAFIGFLTLISIYFAIDEAWRQQGLGRLGKKFWLAYHSFCAFVMVVAAAYMILANGLETLPRAYSLLIGESVAIAAFGASWLAKGAEWRMLFGRPEPSQVPSE